MIADDVARLDAESQRVLGIAARSGWTVSYRLDSMTALGRLAVRDVPVAALTQAADGVAVIDLIVGNDSGDALRLHMAKGSSSGELTSGDIRSLAPALQDDADARSAFADPSRLFAELIANANCEVSVTITNNSPELTWITNEQSLASIVEHVGLAVVARDLAAEHRPARIVIGGTGAFSTSRFIVHDPSKWPAAPVPGPGRTSLMVARAVPRATDLRPVAGDGLEQAREIFEQLAVATAWLTLGVTDLPDGSVQLAEAGPFLTVTSGADPWDLFEFAARTDDALHVEALRASFASARDPLDTDSVLTNAELIVRAAQEGLVAAVVETRRRSREAASAAALASAETARSAVRSLQDRLVLALGAAGGVLVAQRLQFGSVPVALALLLIVGLVIVGAAAVIFHVELPTALGPIDNLNKDLRALVEGLTDRDVDAVMALPSVSDARTRLQAARDVVWKLLIASGAAFGLLFVVVLATGEAIDDANDDTTTTTSSSVTTTTTTTTSTVADTSTTI